MSSGEKFFITRSSILTDTSKIALAPATPGADKELQVEKERWRLNSVIFLACYESVSYNLKRQKLRGAILGGIGGLFVIETAGFGLLLINSYEDIVEIQLDGTKLFIIDNQHVVAWSETLDYTIKVASGIFGFKTGEDGVNEFHGVGTVMIQTRSIERVADLISPFINTGS